MAFGGPWAGDDQEHDDECHARWGASLHRSTAQPDYLDEWCDAQCGGCRFWIGLSGQLGQAYGACTNPASPFDGRVRFEHDGCARFTGREDGSFG
ncbi:DUF3027 domain-containing protein [Streptomyces kanasensis]|uniref:DUF3027 domain-containing protein n=1 Tax=Streptomyces kanasensis TaxID=936756 RepID=UPI0036F541A8